MQGLSTPLVAAAAAFLLVVLWRVRPALPWTSRRRASREALREARMRIESAADPKARALALCDAGDVMAGSSGSAASGLFLKAMRADPNSADVVGRAVTGLVRRPRALESLLWRHLAQAPLTSESREATRAVLDALRVLHEGPLKNSIRARAIANVRDAL